MNIFDKIFYIYLVRKVKKTAKKDWQITGTRTSEWFTKNGSGMKIGTTVVTFFENGLQRRKVKFYSSSGVAERSISIKDGDDYLLIIKPWIDGVNKEGNGKVLQQKLL